MDEPKFIGAPEIARQLNVKPKRVYQMANQGLLPVVRLGRRMFFPRTALDHLEQAAIQRFHTCRDTGRSMVQANDVSTGD